MPARRTLPLLLTALVALAAIAAAAWLVFTPSPRTVADEPTLPLPEQAAPAPMPKPAPPATAP